MHLPDFDEPFDPDLFHKKHWAPARSPPVWCETLAGRAGWHCSNDIVGASQDARAEWRRGGRQDDRVVSLSE
jgi:hypothetical protein